VAVSSNADFSNIEYSATDTGTSITTSALSQGTHYWRVKAQNSIGIWGDWSSVRNFAIEGPIAPGLVSPSNNEVMRNTNTPTLVWNTTTYGMKYNVVVSSNYNFSDTEYSWSDTTTTAITTALSKGDHYWGVRAQNSSEIWGDWSAPRNFKIDGPLAPNLVSPSEGTLTETDTPTLVWNFTPYAVNYNLEVSSNYYFSNIEYSATVTDTSATTTALPRGWHYWRVKAQNSVELWGNCSAKRDFIVIEASVTDIDGNTYQTVKIGNQWWMAENLKVTHYRNGYAIPNVTSNSDWRHLTTGAYCNYDNDANNATTYGRLYNWYAVNDSRKIAPEGWHVPSDSEWKTLEMYLGMSQSDADGVEWRGTNEGSKLKSTSGWYNNGNGTDDFGFSALPGGLRFYNGPYSNVGYSASFWSSTENGSYGAWYRELHVSTSDVYRNYASKRRGFSVRCVRD